MARRIAPGVLVAHAHRDGDRVFTDPGIGPERKLDRAVSLPEMRETPGLEEMALLRRGRLSVQPVTADEWKIILRLGKLKSGQG